jgi:hypothetical protein
MTDEPTDDAADENPTCYEEIVALARRLRRPIKSLLAQSPGTDPFYSGRASLRRDGEWFAALWHRLNIGRAHLRRIHYILLSQAEPVLTPDGSVYENTAAGERLLDSGSRAARHLGLVPKDMFDDHRNAEPIIYIANESEGSRTTGTAWVGEGQTMEKLDELTMAVPDFPPFPDLPGFLLLPPRAAAIHHIEVWAEKTTMNDVLDPLAQRLQINLMTGAGQSSITRCLQVIDRARESGLPVRIVYISDFDPSGENIPVTAARKVEFEIRTRAPDLDVQVRAIVLTHDQCLHYRLPRTPLKDSEGRKPGFEARYGEGATELDALEAQHPGELARIIEREVNRYRDRSLPRRIAAAERRYRERLDAIEAEIYAPYEDVITALQHEYAMLEAAYEALCEPYDGLVDGDEIATFAFAAFEQIRQQLQDLSERIERQWSIFADALHEIDLPDFDWPQPRPADEDPDPLYDSRRSYLDQIARYKRHLGKPVQVYRRKKFFIPTEIAEIYALRDQGVSLNAIAAQFGVTKGAITYHLNRRPAE